MATNTALSPELKLPENDKELLDEASRHASDVQAAMTSLEAHLRDAARLVAAAEKINGVFASVADRLGNATFKASIDTTHGKPAREVAVQFVKELSDLACLSFQGTRDLRRELINAKTSATTVLPALRQAATAMQSLSQALKALATRPGRPAWVKAPIVVENQTSSSATTEGVAERLTDAVRTRTPAAAATFFPASRARRYTN